MALVRKTGRAWLFIAIPVVAILFSLVAVKIVNAIDYHNNDFFTFWLAGHLVTENGDPYSTEQWLAGHAQFGVTWIPNQAYVYPLPLSLIFAPLGLLSLYQAYILWVALSEGMILASALLFIQPGKGNPNRTLFLPILIGAIFFRPTVLTLVNGQLTAWLLFVLACTAWLWNKEKWEWGGFLLSLLFLKPNLGGPIVFLLAIWLLAQKRYKALLSMAAGSIILLVLGMLQNPVWLLDYWSIGNDKMALAFGFSPTIWGLASLVCDFQKTCTLATGGSAAALLVLAAVVILVRRRGLVKPLTVLAIAVTVSLLVTPYSWTYDQLLLLLPVSAIILSIGGRAKGFLPAALLFPALDILVVILLIFNTAMDKEILNAFIPLTVFLLLLWITLKKDRGPSPALQTKKSSSR